MRRPVTSVVELKVFGEELMMSLMLSSTRPLYWESLTVNPDTAGKISKSGNGSGIKRGFDSTKDSFDPNLYTTAP